MKKEIKDYGKQLQGIKGRSNESGVHGKIVDPNEFIRIAFEKASLGLLRK